LRQRVRVGARIVHGKRYEGQPGGGEHVPVASEARVLDTGVSHPQPVRDPGQ
jgi:hypothetical protein